MHDDDPISDMLARIRNAALARHELTRLPASKLKQNIAELLKAEGYVADVREEEWGPKKHQTLTIVLKYGPDKRSARSTASGASRVPGAACTCATTESRACSRGLGVSILSTSHGLMTDKRSAPPQGRRRAPL